MPGRRAGGGGAPLSSTAGRRLILIGLFYIEAEEALRQKINAERRAAEGDNPA